MLGRVLAAVKPSAAYPVVPMTPVSRAARTSPSIRLTRVPEAMIAPARPRLCRGAVGFWPASAASVAPPGSTSTSSTVRRRRRLAGPVLGSPVRCGPLVVGALAGRGGGGLGGHRGGVFSGKRGLRRRRPAAARRPGRCAARSGRSGARCASRRGSHATSIASWSGSFSMVSSPADRLEQVVVDELVDAALAGGEPVVDGAELDEHPPLDAGLLGHLARRGLGQRLLALDVALGQAPLDPARPVAAGDDRDPRLALVRRRRPRRRRCAPPPPAAAGGSPRAGLRRRGSSGHCNQCGCGGRGPRGPGRAAAGRGAGGIPLVLVSTRQPSAALLRRGRRPPGARAAAADRARRALRRRRARARPGRRPGARRAPRPVVDRPRLHHRRARPDSTEALLAAGPTRTGTSAASSARSAPQRGAARSVEVTTYRADAYDRADPQAGGGLRRHPRRRPGPPRLHRQRDGGAAARPRPSSTRTAAWPTSRAACCAPRHRPRCRSATTRCG